MAFSLKFTSESLGRDDTIILVLANICESGFSRFLDWLFAFELASLPSLWRPGLIGSMQFQKAHVSIIRSIRHVSLARDWQRARETRVLPAFKDFVPNDRAGDLPDLSISEVRREGGRLAYLCRQAGPRLEQVHDAAMASRLLSDCLEPAMAAAIKPIWDACVWTKLPVYCIIPVSDRNGCPVTIEQIFLPYTLGGDSVEVMVAALHACSTEGRFVLDGLLRNHAKTPLHWAVIIDPTAAAAPRPVSEDTVVLDDGIPSSSQ